MTKLSKPEPKCAGRVRSKLTVVVPATGKFGGPTKFIVVDVPPENTLRKGLELGVGEARSKLAPIPVKSSKWRSVMIWPVSLVIAVSMVYVVAEPET
jgi:hypothetical protein